MARGLPAWLTPGRILVIPPGLSGFECVGAGAVRIPANEKPGG